jgi:Predicted ATPases of PP-loop superfamily
VADRIVLSWSGGKDSSLALAALRADDRYELVALLTSITREYDRVSIHGVRRRLLEAQAQSIGLPLFEVSLSAASSNPAYEEAFRVAVGDFRAAHPDVRHMAFGDLFLADVRAYRERQTATLGMTPVFPLWGRDTAQLAREFIAAGYGAHLVCVDTEQLAAEFAGRAFDGALMRDLPPSVDPCGENGEFHTFVSRGPIFREPIGVEIGELVLRDDRFAYRDLIAAERSDSPGRTGVLNVGR